MRRLTSIRTRLQGYFLFCLFLLFGVAGFAILALIEVDRITEELDERWLAGTRILGETADQVTQFRLDSARLALATGTDNVWTAGETAKQHRHQVEKLRAAFAELPRTGGELQALRVFDEAWTRFSDEYSAWAALSYIERLRAAPAFQERADDLYQATQDAIGKLIAANTAGANDAAKTADQIVGATAALLTIVSLTALALGGWVLLVIRNGISRPLAAITSALSRLAAGNRDVVVPESDRGDEIGEMAKAFEIFRSNAFALEEAHKAAEAAQLRAQALARHDPLTGLTNRRVLTDDLEKALSRVDRFGGTFAVLLIDLDRFKPVNDIHGHPAGDIVLCEIADRLKEIVRKTDTLSRIGGDEFAVVCDLEAESAETSEEIILFADRVLEAVRTPIQVGESQVELDASIGIAFGPADGREAEPILRAADIAMYRAKRAGRGTFRFYEPSMDEELRTRAELEADVRRAVAAGEIEPHFQPLIELATGRLVGFEVLARWNHPKKGNIPPTDFIPIVEHLGLVADFTWGILRRACLAAKTWPGELQLSVNVSPIQLKDLTFPARLLSVLYEADFPPHRLEIEITETALLSDLETVKVILVSLQNLGVKVALDDFGTGYSSLYHLRELKLDKIKIDRSFIKSIQDNPESAKIVNAILGLAKSLSLPTTAEGIEDADVVIRMTALGCDIGQGYFFGKAMSADDVPAWMHAIGADDEAEKRHIA